MSIKSESNIVHTKLHQCNQCDKAFALNSKLKIHMSTHTGLKPYQCSHCNKAFSYNNSFIKHMKIHSEHKKYHCKKCDKSFADRSNLKLHYCDTVFTDNIKLVNHLVTHPEETTFQCSQCNKVFEKKKQLSNHQRVHSGDKPYKCSQCDKVFSYPRSLKFHMKSHVKSNEFENHLKTHPEEIPFQCSHCRKTFSHNKDLIRHLKIHTGVKQHQCSQCDKAYIELYNLKIHMRKHTGEKPYQCKYCGKSFSQNGILKTHLRKHTGEKPYQCRICSKDFALKNYLICHMRTHTGEKPFQCSKCDKSFSQRIGLKLHMRTHTGNKPYQCSLCVETFLQKQDLSTHYRTYHHTMTQINIYVSHMKTHTGKKGNAKGFTSKSKKSKIPASDESDETFETHLTQDKQSESLSHKCQEKFLLKKPTNFSKNTIKMKKSIIKSDKESKKKNPQSLVTKNKKLKSGKENEEYIQVKKSKNQCDTAFKQNSKLKMHMGTHTGLKPYQCSHCNKAFSYNNSFIKHMRMHSEANNNTKSDVPEMLALGIKNNQSKSKINEKVKDERSTADNDVIILSDEDGTTQQSETMDDVLWAIDKVFDLFEESTEGIWTKTPNQIEQDLYDVIQSLKLDRFEDNSYPKIYNLDVNYRQLYILLSGVDSMVLEHALLCTKSYPHCKDIPEKHKEDMSCCISKSGELSLKKDSFAPLNDKSTILDIPKFTVNKYVSCRYETGWWIGMIQNIDEDADDYEIKFLHPHGPSKSFYWPTRDDICYVSIKNILCLISTPSTINGRTYNILVDDNAKTDLAFKKAKANLN